MTRASLVPQSDNSLVSRRSLRHDDDGDDDYVIDFYLSSIRSTRHS